MLQQQLKLQLLLTTVASYLVSVLVESKKNVRVEKWFVIAVAVEGKTLETLA